jgi:protease-4
MARKRPWSWLLLSFLILILLFWGITTVIGSLFGSGVDLAARDNVLMANLSGSIVEQPAVLFGADAVGPLSLREIDTALRDAADDPRVSGVVLQVGPLITGFGKAQEIRSAIHAFRASGKRVVARLEIGTLIDLYVASAADEIVQVPSGQLILGLMSQRQYYRELFDTLGIEFETFHTGPYKTAMEGYTSTGMSPEEREAIETLMEDLYDQIVTDIAADREVTPDQVEEVIDRGLVTAARMLEAGLVDRLGFADSVRDELPGGRVSLRDYHRATATAWSFGRPRIALVHVDGMILPGDPGTGLFGGGLTGGDRLAAAIRKARQDAAVRAMVIRVDSPGGAVTGSDVILREVQLTAEKMPVIISMSDVAASGGYWVATGGTRILADAATYTGSIGVVMARFNLAGTYEKLGIGNAVVKRGQNADIFADSRPLNEDQKAVLQASIEATYADFIGKVAAARDMPEEEVEALAQGRVWTGRQALERGLVDQLGGLRAALSAARREAGLPPGTDVALAVYPEQPGLFEQVGSMFTVARARSDARFELSDLAAERLDLLRRFAAAGNTWLVSDQALPGIAH